jgi:subtilisin family serine protease
LKTRAAASDASSAALPILATMLNPRRKRSGRITQVPILRIVIRFSYRHDARNIEKKISQLTQNLILNRILFSKSIKIILHFLHYLQQSRVIKWGTQKMALNKWVLKNSKLGIVTISFCAVSVASAANIGVVDSGTDFKHPVLQERSWINPGGLPGDSFSDDVHGWNFAENNNQVIDYSYLGTFSPDTAKFFEIQLRVMEGTATEEDKKWIAEKRKDPKFIEELSTFANFVHGTHVAGITARTAEQAKVMAAKIIPTKIKRAAAAIASLLSSGNFGVFALEEPTSGGPMDDIMMNGALGMLAGRQVEMLTKVGQYLGVTKMEVANCSFGTGGAQGRMIAKLVGKMLLKRDLNEAEAAKYGRYFMDQIIAKGSAFMTASTQTLFVVAAGNDGADNDKEPVFPANVKVNNSITVAATRGFDKLASFSNYGTTMVDIAAPGVGIVSTIPGDGQMAMSGTSQASPFVANLAGKVLDKNPNLKPAEVKQILMQTVDKKSFLVGKVVSEGTANEERAVRAAALSAEMSVGEAILQAKSEVRSPRSRMHSGSRMGEGLVEDGEALPLPSFFSFE